MRRKELIDKHPGAGHAIDQYRMGDEINRDRAATVHRQAQCDVSIRPILGRCIGSCSDHIAVKVKGHLGQTGAAVHIHHKAESSQFLRHAASVIQRPGDAVAAVQITTARLDPTIHSHAHRIGHGECAISGQLANRACVHPPMGRDRDSIEHRVQGSSIHHMVGRTKARQHISGFAPFQQLVAVAHNCHKPPVHQRSCGTQVRCPDQVGRGRRRHAGCELHHGKADPVVGVGSHLDSEPSSCLGPRANCVIVHRDADVQRRIGQHIQHCPGLKIQRIAGDLKQPGICARQRQLVQANPVIADHNVSDLERSCDRGISGQICDHVGKGQGRCQIGR